jgi:ribonuclease D
MIYKNFGVKLENLFDTYLAAQLIETGHQHEKGFYALDGCVRRHVDPYAYSAQMYLGMPHATKKVRDSFATVDVLTPEQITYAALDVHYSYILYLKQREMLSKRELEGSYVGV